MTAAALAKAATPILRTAAGEPPLGAGGEAFRADQGEMLFYDHERSAATRIGVLELEDGTWLSFPFGVDRERYQTRAAALRAGIAAMVRKARRYMRNAEGEGTHWSEGFAGRVIEWALSLKLIGGDALSPPKPEKHVEVPKGTSEEINPLANAANGLATESPSEEITPQDGLGITDPIVAELVAAHRVRKTYPAGHTFAMTNPVINGHMVTLGSCSCGETFSYAYGSAGHEKMDAAIEAHRQKFDAIAEKIDGRGNPINAAIDNRVEPGNAKQPRKRKPVSAPEGTPAPEPASPDLALGGAGVVIEAAPIGAGSDEYLAGITARNQMVGGLPVTAAPFHAERTGPRDAASASKLNADLETGVTAGETAGSEVISGTALCSNWPGVQRALCDSVTAGETAPNSIGASSIAQQMAASPGDDWSPLLNAALDLAWREPPQVTAQLKALLDFSKVYGVGADVERPVLRWHGGKWRIAPWVMSFFPEHRIYVEPFGGAGSILLRKRRVYAEVYNDLDDVVTNLFRVLRDEAKAAKLIEALRLTPFSRAEFKEALLEAEDDVERARHLIVRSFMGFGSNAHSGSSTAEKTGFKSFTRPDEYRSTGFRANSSRSGTTPAHDWANYPDALPAIVDRLRGVIVEQRPAIEVMRQHDGEMTLHYVDPPYLPETRSPANKYDLKHRMYRHELTVDDHHELLAFLHTLRGFVVLSGYPSQLYEDALPDWRRVTCATHADGARERTEVLWLNPACVAALDQQHPALFDIAALDAVNTPPLGHDGS